MSHARRILPFPPDPADLLRARALILRHGWNATAYQILNPGIHLWFSRNGDAVAGFVDCHGVRVVAGAPVCADHRLRAAAEELERDSPGMAVCYFCAGSRLMSVLDPSVHHSSVVLGAQPAWDPHAWSRMLQEHASLRAQLNRARNKGAEVTEWPAQRAAVAPELRRCLEEWLATRGLPPLHFLVETRTLERLYDRRVFVARQDGTVVGFLVATPIPARGGWLIEQIVRSPAAANGTAELLIDAVVEAARLEGSHYVTLGLSPLSIRAGRPGAGGPLWLRGVLGWMRAHVHRFYNFEGLEAFKAKFRPAVWEPIYAVANRPSFTPRLLYAIAGAFSDRSVPSTVGRALGGAARQEAAWIRRRVRASLSPRNGPGVDRQ